MRCKNCGTYNDDNRYICETCGSPLYDEEDITTEPKADDRTQTFNAVTNPVTPEPVGQNEPPHNNRPENPKDSAEKKSAIVIAILVVVLVAIIVSVVVVAVNKSKSKDETTTEITTSQSTTASTTKQTTQPTTEKTTTTTTTTTAPTTTAQIWYINVSSSGGGTVNGTGEYKNGDRVTITAAANDGYEFDGWYSNGVKVSDKAKYSFTANENVSFSAVFNPVAEPTDESIENLNGME